MYRSKGALGAALLRVGQGPRGFFSDLYDSMVEEPHFHNMLRLGCAVI